MLGVFFNNEGEAFANSVVSCENDGNCASGEFCDNGYCSCIDIDEDDICDDVDTCIDKDGDGYGIGNDCASLDCNDNNLNSWRIGCFYIDQDNDGYHMEPTADICNAEGFPDKMRLCYGATEPPVGFASTTAGEDCNDSDPTKTVDCSSFNPDPDPEQITIKAHKVVCEDEIYLPDWGNNGNYPTEGITNNTASDYVAEVNAINQRKVCWLESDWQFQWGFNDKTGQKGVDKAGAGDFIGEANGITASSTGLCPKPWCGPNTYTNSAGSSTYEKWNTFGPTDSTGSTTVIINDLQGASGIWVREVLKEGYIPYTYPPLPKDNPVSAELYCKTDTLNYDNYDEIEDIEDGGTYYCVAFNAPKRVKIKAYKVVCEDETYLPNWGASTPMFDKPSKIGFNTAENYIASTTALYGREVCWLAKESWKFQWGFGDKTGQEGVDKAGSGDFIGEANGILASSTDLCPEPWCGPNTYTNSAGNYDYEKWNTFGSTSNGSTTIIISDLQDAPNIWVREVLQTGYIPYTYPPLPKDNNVSAELYCQTDILNYDNYDEIENIKASGVYYCVAFNAPKKIIVATGTITVCKYEDTYDYIEHPISGWMMHLNGDEYYGSTGDNGCVTFDDLLYGEYIVSEENQEGWTQTYPGGATTTHTVMLNSENSGGKVYFLNAKDVIPCSLRCGNGMCETECDETYSTCPQDCDSSGGGGGSVTTELMIFNERVAKFNNDYVVSWLTNKYATSRVVYGTSSLSVSELNFGNLNYGYASTTKLFDENPKVTGHEVKVENLQPDTTYYFRPVSTASPAKYGKELSFTTTDTGEVEAVVEENDEVVVLGEEGAPILGITKVVLAEFADQRDTNVEYVITITNMGNLTAFTTSLIDTLPTGLTFSDEESNTKTWNLGDIEAGETKIISYLVNVNADAEPMIYTNTAKVSALNHEEVSANASLEVRVIEVLAETGFDVKEFTALLLSLGVMIGLTMVLKRKSS